MNARFYLTFFPLLLSALFNVPTSAFAWQTQVVDSPYLPKQFIAVEKAKKQLYVFEKQSPLQLKVAFPSIHGEIEGDKETEGDLKTPEGIYFVTSKIRYQLDFIKYGSGAYALNYPNPVDKIKQKTGGGIWIHSKGNPIEGQFTQGCVAVDLNDFNNLVAFLPSGTPVILAHSIVSDTPQPLYIALQGNQTQVNPLAENSTFNSTPSSTVEQTSLSELPEVAEVMIDNVTLQEPLMIIDKSKDLSSTQVNEAIADDILGRLIQRTKDWNKAWEARSSEFFDFYNGPLYTLAQNETFEAFKAQKESLFKILPWIQIIHGEVHALTGPDYWVTWFTQYYKAPNLTSEGTRRLYWQKDEQGEFKIVGMEWIPDNLGMAQTYIANVQPEIEAILEDWKNAWLNADVEKYATFYAENAYQGNRRGKEIFEQKQEIWNVKQPRTLEFTDTRITMENGSVRVQMKQIYTDSSGYRDVGVKTMIFYPENDTWRIAREDWRRI